MECATVNADTMMTTLNAASRNVPRMTAGINSTSRNSM